MNSRDQGPGVRGQGADAPEIRAEVSYDGRQWMRDREIELLAGIWLAANIEREFRFPESLHVLLDRALLCPVPTCRQANDWLIIRDGAIRCQPCDADYQDACVEAKLAAARGRLA